MVITGNIDTPDVEEAIDESKATNITSKKVAIQGIVFIGLNEINQDDFKILKQIDLLDKKIILISHKTPYGTQDKIFIGRHGGSKDLKEVVEKYKPFLVLCGHFHEDPGFSKISETVVVNCSMGKRGEGAFIELNDKISVKMLD